LLERQAGKVIARASRVALVKAGEVSGVYGGPYRRVA
jgi:hypothetical protein